MPEYYAVLDNGSGSTARKPRLKRRAAVDAYVAKTGGTRKEGREKFEQRKAVRAYVTAKGGKLSADGSRGKREKRLRAEGRAAYAASKKPKTAPKAKANPTTGGTRGGMR